MHDLHNDYSLASEKIVMKESILSDYCKRLKQISIVFQLTVTKILYQVCVIKANMFFIKETCSYVYN